jgi:dihydrofolate synthase/folylpolyglutamate synthase
VNLAGSHQLWNAALAVHALALSGVRVGPEAVARGLKTVEWPGRFQFITDRVVLDGAHNPAAAARLATTWREVFGEERGTIVLGVLGDKDVRAICAALAPIAARGIAVPVQNPRSSQPEDVAAQWREVAPGLRCETAPHLAAALGAAMAGSDRVLICGSLFLVGEALTHAGLLPAHGERSAQ